MARSYRYQPAQDTPFRISRSKVDLFLNCPCCFYLDVRLGVKRPPGFPFNLNSAVDALLKKEFDHYRARVSRILCKRRLITAEAFFPQTE